MHSEPVQICVAELTIGALVHLYNNEKLEKEHYFLEKSGKIKSKARLVYLPCSEQWATLRGKHFKGLSSVKYHIDFSLQEQQNRLRNIIFLEEKCMHNLKRPATFYYSTLKRAENNILGYFVN